MAIFTILRRTASSAIPRSIRSIVTQRNYSSAILKNTNICFSQGIIPRTFSPILNFSSLSTQSKSDLNLVQILDSEIEEEEESCIELDEIPDWFPFEIKDDPGKQTITLGSNYQGEDIKVVVQMPGPVEEEGEEDGDNNEESVQTCISMIVSVAKGRNKPCLEFGCTVYPDEISIDSLSVRDPDTSEDDLAYEGPNFSDLDENLQNAFHKYLEVRGIKPSTTNFLYEYMSNKENKEYLNWLKNVKYFVEK
ncbi:Mitochondrial glycoprotein [Thalictrum thalictroides]|uniref:Mitochondrial glycoprotein n=1 Tax=Thalictrum thalictroides TaxID=46969 RepID=A0A7J6WYM6_THATH|nr:Mitochondrial glycoprotein [Thalictrum thalictroides]